MNNYRFNEVIGLVYQERLRQEQIHSKSCNDVDMEDTDKLPVLLEEVGEVAKEICDKSKNGRNLYLAQLEDELVQVAAVAVAWLEALRERRNSTDAVQYLFSMEDKEDV